MAIHFVNKVSFGPFLFEPKTGRLTKHGQKVRLQPKSAAVLTSLLEDQGEVVTREQLRSVLWPDGTYVAFDLGIKVAVKKLRDALCDSADDPMYVQTVPGQGYRFTAQVKQVLAADETRVGIGGRVPSPGPNPTLQPDELGQASGRPGSARPWLQKRSVTFLAVALVGVVLVAFVAMKLSWRRVQAPPQAQVHRGKIMLVVLPFENLSGDSSQEYLSDGITEELSEQLGNLNPERLGVIGRTSAMTYKHSSRTIRQIGKELGVGYVLEGSVRRGGKKLRITAQLLEVSDQAHLWAADYDSSVRDLVQLEDDIARQITREVGVSIAVDGAEKLKRHRPNPEAHEAYLLGRYYWNKRTSGGEGMAGWYFRRAIQLDPQYAAAYAGLAESGAKGEAKAAALRAVELDPGSSEAHTALGFFQFFHELDLPAAERELRAAIQLDPNYATAHHWYAFVLEAKGQLPEAVAEIREAAKLDPLSLIIRSALAGSLSELGEQSAALAQLKIVFDMDPNFPKGHETLGMVYMKKGMYTQAIREFQTAEQYGGYKLSGVLGYAYARVGNKKEALRLAAELEGVERKTGSGGAAEDLAYIEMGVGDRDKAMKWLEREYADHNDDGLMELKADPIFAPLRSDPRFQDLLRRMKLPSWTGNRAKPT